MQLIIALLYLNCQQLLEVLYKQNVFRTCLFQEYMLKSSHKVIMQSIAKATPIKTSYGTLVIHKRGSQAPGQNPEILLMSFQVCLIISIEV